MYTKSALKYQMIRWYLASITHPFAVIGIPKIVRYLTMYKAPNPKCDEDLF